jgi:hydrogenase/urease accessory protein HupE
MKYLIVTLLTGFMCIFEGYQSGDSMIIGALAGIFCIGWDIATTLKGWDESFKAASRRNRRQ